MAAYTFVVIILFFIINIEYKDKNGDLPEFVHALQKIISLYMSKTESINISFDNFQVTIRGIFLFFFVTASFILLKLMNSLARINTRELRKKAETLSLVQRVRILFGSNIYSISQKVCSSDEVKEGKLSVSPQKWGKKFDRLVYMFNNSPCFFELYPNQKQPSKNPKSTE